MKNIHPLTFLVIVPLYLLMCISLLYVTDMTVQYFIGFIICWILIGGIGLELGHHRYWAHNQFKVNKITEWIISYLGCLSVQGSPLFWRSHHMMHHRYTDRDGDPHSPMLGFYHAYIGWSINKENVNKINFKYAGKKMLADKFQLALQKNNYYILYGSFLLIYTMSSSFFWLSFIPAVFLAFNQGPLVNWFCHRQGNEIKTRNVNWLSFITWGLSLHDNHHIDPKSINFASNNTTKDFGYVLYNLTLRYV